MDRTDLPTTIYFSIFPGQKAATLFNQAAEVVAAGGPKAKRVHGYETCKGDVEAAMKLIETLAHENVQRDGNHSGTAYDRAYGKEKLEISKFVLGCK